MGPVCGIDGWLLLTELGVGLGDCPVGLLGEPFEFGGFSLLGAEGSWAGFEGMVVSVEAVLSLPFIL